MSIKIDSWSQKDCTLGRLSYGSFNCFTLELPDYGNQIGISCIPEGKYKAIKYKSPSKGDVLLLQDVPGRTFIEVHAGNFTRQIEGCILVGDGIKYLDNDSIPDVTNSRVTLQKLLGLIPNEVWIEISRAGEER